MKIIEADWEYKHGENSTAGTKPLSLLLSSHCRSLPQPVTVTYTPVAAASTWSYTSYRDAGVEGFVSTADTILPDVTATTVKRVTTET